MQALPPGPPPPNAEMYRDVSRGIQPPLPQGMQPPNMRGGAPPFGFPGRGPLHGGGRGGPFPPYGGRGGRGGPGGMPWNGPPLPPGAPPPRKARCVDFFDKGCCLRGASCQFDHGVDRIVGAPGADGDSDAIVLTGGEEYNPDQPYWKPGGGGGGGDGGGGGRGRGRGRGRGGEFGRWAFAFAVRRIFSFPQFFSDVFRRRGLREALKISWSRIAQQGARDSESSGLF